ncbi:murein L,D-transpeptidase [Flavobacterium sp.]|uniref:L,D-transpeptidase family protein n=1 Tax=Flavobacterium sp. TaxID=239 RepID=UPI0028BD68F7|nr:L,D-transpeptidase family protein [Flavobacterium sp.]
MSYKYLFFLAPIFLFSCKKDTVLAHTPQKDTIKVVPLSSPEAIAFDSLLIKDKPLRIQEFYKNNLYKTVWTKTEDRENLISLIKATESEGLEPDDYSLKTIERKEKSRATLPEAEIIATDFLLTESFQRLANHLYNGKIDPTQLYKDWEMHPKELKAIDLLQEALRNHTVAQTLDTLKPKHFVYHQLVKSLAKINSYPKDNIGSITVVDKIKPNDTVPEIKTVKERLAYWGDYRMPDSLTTIYDEKTVAAIKHFQTRHGLVADGIIGKGTAAALNVTRNQRKQQILVNLERWRWFPRHLGDDYVIVNIPEFKLYAVKGNDTTRTHKVVVGRDKRRTPILSSKFSNLVINPTWTVPPTIIKEDLGPAGAKNRGYFAATGITIYNSKGAVVDPYSWNAAKPNNYRYVQKPGSNNSLGLVKFNFPNGHLVYLHDTNHRELFALNGRALSSGCVRVENPLDLAYYILETDENIMNQKRVEKILESKKTSGIPLKKPIFVHQWYWTSWMDKNGLLEFRNDIYNLDFELYEKLRN